MKELIAGQISVAWGRRWVVPPSDDGKSQAKETGKVVERVSKSAS